MDLKACFEFLEKNHLEQTLIALRKELSERGDVENGSLLQSNASQSVSVQRPSRRKSVKRRRTNSVNGLSQKSQKNPGFYCSYEGCGKSFSSKGNLKRHGFTHSGEKPHVCVVCQKRFARSDDLKVHLRIHTKEKPYSCNACGKNFARISDLRSHERLHVKYEKSNGNPKKRFLTRNNGRVAVRCSPVKVESGNISSDVQQNKIQAPRNINSSNVQLLIPPLEWPNQGNLIAVEDTLLPDDWENGHMSIFENGMHQETKEGNPFQVFNEHHGVQDLRSLCDPSFPSSTTAQATGGSITSFSSVSTLGKGEDQTKYDFDSQIDPSLLLVEG